MRSAARAPAGNPPCLRPPPGSAAPSKGPLRRTEVPVGHREASSSLESGKCWRGPEEPVMNSSPGARSSNSSSALAAGAHHPLRMRLGHLPADSPRAPCTSTWLVCLQPILPDSELPEGTAQSGSSSQGTLPRADSWQVFESIEGTNDLLGRRRTTRTSPGGHYTPTLKDSASSPLPSSLSAALISTPQTIEPPPNPFQRGGGL